MTFRFVLVVFGCGLFGSYAQARAGQGRIIARVNTGWKVPVRALAIGPSGTHLAAGGDAKQLILYNVIKRRNEWIGSARGKVTALAFSPDGKWLAVGWQGREIDLLAVSTGRVVRRIGKLRGWPLSVAFSPDGKVLAVAGQAQQIALYNPHTGALLGLLVGHTSWVNAVAFSPDGRLVAGAGWDHAVRVWDVATRRLVSSGFGHRYGVNSVVFDHAGKVLITASDDQSIRVFDAQRGLSLKKTRGLATIRMALASKADVLVCGTHGGHLLFMRQTQLQPFRIIKAHRGPTYAVAVTPDGQLAVSGGRHGNVIIWRVK